ncbi:MAG: hypothetical protein WAW11_02395 [Patescibacteria group bacterium]
MHLFKTKSFKLVLASIVLVFAVAILSVSDIFQTRDIPGAEAAGVAINATDIDTCGISTSVNGNITKSGAGASCVIKSTTGIIGGNLNIANGAKVTINAGAKLVLSPGQEIIIDKANGSEIIMATGGDSNNGIVHGTVCVRDDDGDGYMNSGTGFAVALNSQACSSLNSGSDIYIAKTSATSLTEADCYNTDNSKYSCCTSGYRDYDKDGYGRNSDANSCYAADSAYNIVANNYDCNDSVAGITNNNTDYNGCGSGACAGTGSNVCTNGVTVVNPCVVSAQACCDAGGNPRPNGTVISSCSSCNGSSAAPIAYANGTICSYGSYGGYGNSAGSCYIYSSRPYYTCSSGSCSGSVAGYDYQYQYPSTTGNVWNGSSWITANCSTNAGYGSGQYCTSSSYGGYSQRLAYGCTTGGSPDTGSPTATCNQSQCLNRNENGVSCSGGNCVGSTNCGDSSDNDSDGLTDNADSACGGCGQCTPSSCCDSNGCFINGPVCNYGGWSAYTNSAGSCYAYRSRAYYTWSNCSCNYAGTDYEYSYGSNGQVWNGSAWAAGTFSNRCGTGSYSCSGTTSIQLGFYACNGGNSCSTYMGTGQAATCGGCEDSICVSGSCQNKCSDGSDNNSNGLTDGQESCCGGYGQCSSGACCNTANGSFYGTNTICSYGNCSSPSSGSGCSYTYNNRNCSGSSASCTGSYTASGGTCYCGSGTTWNGSSCAAANASNYCGTGGSYSCSGNNQYVNTLGCNGAGTCNYNTGSTVFNQTCATSSSYYCSGNQAYYRTNGCIGGSCTYSDSTTTYCDGVSKICSSGSCISPSCAPGSSGGYSWGTTLSHGSVTGTSRSISNGSCTANLSCSYGTVTVQSESCGCNSGYDWNGSACVDCINDSGCGTGYYCYLSTYNPSYDWCTVGTVNACSRKCWNISQTLATNNILEGNTASNNYNTCATSISRDDPHCDGAPACGSYCQSGGSSGYYVGSVSGDQCYKYNGLGFKYWVNRNIYKCYMNQTVTKWYNDACAPSSGYTSQSGRMNEYGSCVIPSYCGDWTCNSNEDCSNCANDCGQCVICGDGMCVSGEDFYNCSDDCPAGGGSCNYNYSCEDYNGESCRSCYNDCYSCSSCNYNGTCDYNEDSSSCYNDCWNY